MFGKALGEREADACEEPVISALLPVSAKSSNAM
jgi:hypothetical protein